MRKKLFVVLLGAVLLPTSVCAQTPVKNNWGYKYDGHTPDEVKVDPYSKAISVARDVTLDDQVIYLYNPKYKVFISGDGNWGTEAVGRYEGFGMPFNLIDPSSDPFFKNDGVGDKAQWLNGTTDGAANAKILGYGFYCEAFEQGHYLGRDYSYYVGGPSFWVDGQKTNRARFYVDRGGSWGDAETNTLKAETWKNGRAESDNVFTWHFEQVENVNYGNNSKDPKIYRLYICMPNSVVPNNPTLDDYPYLKHYVKLESLNPFGDGEFYALTTARANTPVNNDGKDEPGSDTLKGDDYVVDSSDYTDDDGAAIAKDDDAYYWQIVTRADLKNNFLLEFKDPYTAKETPGNATFNLDNPDFSRSLEKTVNDGNTGKFPAFWKEDDDKVYTYDRDIYGNLSYGRFTFMHPNNDGSLTQTFKPYQWGLFRVDVSGFTFGGSDNLKAKLSLSAKKPDETISQIKISDPVYLDKIDETEDAQNIRQRIHEIARYSGIDDNRNYIKEGHATLSIYQNVEGQYYYPGKTEAHNDEGHWNPALTITTDGSGKISGATGIQGSWGNDVKGLYCIKHIDKYGRLAPGIYINGNGSIVGDGVHRYKITKSDGTSAGWKEDLNGAHELEVEIGDKVELGPDVPGFNAPDNANEGHHHWWTPTGDFNDHRGLEFIVNYDSEGDYILTYNNKEKTEWSVAHYRIKVIAPKLTEGRTPEADHVNFTNNRPVIIENNEAIVNNGFAFTITEGTDNAGYDDQEAYQDAVSEQDVYYIERAVGEFLYNDKNSEKYAKSVFFYVKQEYGAENDDVTIKLNFEGIGGDYLKNFIALDNVRLTYCGDTPFIIDEKNRISTAQQPVSGNELIPVYINRHFDEGAWNAFVCPVPLNVGQVRGAFGSEVKISEITENGLDPKNPYRIEFKTVELGENLSERVILPGHFYLVKPSAVSTVPSVAQIVQPDASTYVIKRYNNGAFDDADDGLNSKYNFVPLGNHDLRKDKYVKEGDTYKLVAGGEGLIPTGANLIQEGDYYVWDESQIDKWNPYDSNNDRFPGYSKLEDVTGVKSPYRRFTTKRYLEGYQAREDVQGVDHNAIELRGSYAPQELNDTKNSYVFATKENETRLVHLKEGSSVNKLQGSRFYIHDIAKNTPANAKPFTFVVDGVEDEDEFTGINNAVSVAADNGDIYTISGQKVNGTLQKGVYVKNGKKFLVK